jgi:hypothetical protein
VPFEQCALLPHHQWACSLLRTARCSAFHYLLLLLSANGEHVRLTVEDSPVFCISLFIKCYRWARAAQCEEKPGKMVLMTCQVSPSEHVRICVVLRAAR